jgi:hypothetical protein
MCKFIGHFTLDVQFILFHIIQTFGYCIQMLTSGRIKSSEVQLACYAFNMLSFVDVSSIILLPVNHVGSQVYLSDF